LHLLLLLLLLPIPRYTTLPSCGRKPDARREKRKSINPSPKIRGGVAVGTPESTRLSSFSSRPISVGPEKVNTVSRKSVYALLSLWRQNTAHTESREKLISGDDDEAGSLRVERAEHHLEKTN